MTATFDLAAKRREFGIAKYGMPLEVDNGREPLADAVEEALDLVAYLMQECARVKQWQPAHPNDIWLSLLEGGFDWMLAQSKETEVFIAYVMLDSLVTRAQLADIAIVAQPASTSKIKPGAA